MTEAIQQAIVDAICAEIASSAVEQALSINGSSPVNEGQMSLADDLEPQIEDSWDSIYEGEPPIILDTPHPEAWGIITNLCSELLTTAAEISKAVRDAEELL